MTNIMQTLKEKFSSGNGTPVSRSVITREEYEQLLQHIQQLNAKAAPQVQAGTPERTAFLLRNEAIACGGCGAEEGDK